MIVVLFQKQVKRPANDNELLLCGLEGKAWAAMLRKLAGLRARDETGLRSMIRSLANMVDPRPGVIDFPPELTTA